MALGVMTVLGSRRPEELGTTPTHEHLFMDATSASTGDEASSGSTAGAFHQ
jgi:predicted metal-dependent phosphotriesterase family hydrolase